VAGSITRIALCALCVSVCSVVRLAIADDVGSGVYIRDSAVVVEKLALTDRLEHLGEWGKAADVFQDLLQNQGDRVVLSSRPGQYQSVTQAVQERLCHWPAEGLEVYRGRFETQAQGSLQQALAENRPEGVDDLGMLHRVFSDYFVTDAGKTAGMRLMDAAIENGEFAAAEWIGQRLLDSHPMLMDDRPRILFREGIAQHLAGNDAAAAAELSELADKFPAALDKVGGKDAVLHDALAEALKQPLVAAVSTGNESWPMPFGSSDRARLPVSSGFGGALLFGVPIDTALPRGSGIPAGSRTELKQLSEKDREDGLTLGVLPVVDRGELFFQDNVHVYAVSLESGLSLADWVDTYPADHQGRYTISGGGWPMPRCQQDSICVTDDSVLAVMGQMDMNAANYAGSFIRDTRLVCLDRKTGRERWVATPVRLPPEPAALRQLDFGGSPLVVGNSVYLIAKGGEGMQFQDCYVVCLDLQTGNYKWSSYLASANNTAQMWEMDVAASAGLNVSHIAYNGGRLYVATNVGAVAAVDAYSGSVIWLNMYPRPDNQPDRLMGAQVWNGRMQPNDSDDGDKPWTNNPVIVRDGKVFVMPADGSNLHVYDAGSGEEIKRVGLSMRVSSDNNEPFETVNTLVGIGGEHGEWAVMASDRSIYCIDWKNFEPAKGTDNLRWGTTFARGAADDKTKYPDDSIRGRPFMTTDSVYVPLAWAMVRMSLRNGATLASFPPSGAWDNKDDGPGNVLVTQDHLIVAGAQHVNVYTDIALATRKLDAAIAAAPTDPDVRLRYAEVLSAADRYEGPDGAAAKLDQAAALLHAGSPATAQAVATPADAGATAAGVVPSVASGQSRLFNDALAFTQKLEKENHDPSGTLIDSLYDRAAAAAVTPAQQVTYRLQRAAHLHQKPDSAGELALYQQILKDPQMRSVIIANGENAASPAGTLARTAIADLIQRCGTSIYAPYEQAASSAVQATQTLPDAEKAQQLVAVAEIYPNSQAAVGAMLDAAGVFEADGNPREAAALMRQFCSQYPYAPERAKALETLARAYLDMPNRIDSLNVAIGRLDQGAKLDGPPKLSRPLRLPDGTQIENVTFAQAADTLRGFQAQIAAKALPDPQIPTAVKRAQVLAEDADAAIADVASLTLPLQDWARHDRVVTFSASRGLSVYAVGSNRPVFTCSAVTEAPRNVAWMGGNLLVWCPSQLILIRGEGTATTAPSIAQSVGAGAMAAGDVIWDSPLHALPAAQFASVGGGTDEDDDAANPGGEDVDVAGGPQINGPINGAIIVNGRRIFTGNGRVIIGRGGQLRIVGGMPPGMIAGVGAGGVVNPPNPVGNQNGENAAEQIDRIVPTGDRLVFSTRGGEASGRVVSLSLADGHVQWQTSLEDHQIEQLAANDDFIVIRAADDTDVRLVAFDALTGQPVWRPKPFGRENSDAEVPINFVLAEDGSLVYLMPDRICCKDLFDPDPKLRFDRPVSHNNLPNANGPSDTFAGATAADQLLISEGRVLVLSDNGSFVRVYTLADGKPYIGGPSSEGLLNTEVTDSPWNVHLRIVGSRLYMFGPNKVKHYDLDKDHDFYTLQVETSSDTAHTTVGIRDLILTKEDLLLLLEPASVQHRDPDSPYSPALFFRAYSREIVPSIGRESGSLKNFDRMVNEVSGIQQVQVVDGGIYYASGDHQLHFLKGKAGGDVR
jgi:outer membrane protein assembly factor BamB